MAAVEKDVSEKAAKVVETVTMTDGRQVEFAGKKKLLKDYDIQGDAVVCRFDFRNGETRTLVIGRGDELTLQYAGHGALQKVGDECAGVEDTDDMVLAVDDILERLGRREWTTKREGGGFGGTSVLLRALVEFTGKSVEQIKEFLKGTNQAEKMALRNSAKLKPIVERLEAEKASKAAKVDTESLFAKI